MYTATSAESTGRSLIAAWNRLNRRMTVRTCQQEGPIYRYSASYQNMHMRIPFSHSVLHKQDHVYGSESGVHDAGSCASISSTILPCFTATTMKQKIRNRRVEKRQASHPTAPNGHGNFMLTWSFGLCYPNVIPDTYTPSECW